MKTKFLLTMAMAIAISLTSQTTNAQGLSVNTSGAKADTSAMLDVSSTSKGMLVPRMNTTQRNNITLPATGLMIYQTDGTSGFYYNSGTSTSPIWATVGGGG